MTVITPHLPALDETCYVVIGEPTGQTVFGVCDYVTCDGQVKGTHETFIEHIEAIHETPRPHVYTFHHNCAAKLLAGMFDHYMGDQTGCPFCGARWSEPDPVDRSVYIIHEDHCLYDALVDELADYDRNPDIEATLDLNNIPDGGFCRLCEENVLLDDDGYCSQSCREIDQANIANAVDHQPTSIDMPIGKPVNLLVIAAGLLSEHGENPEYDRAIVELTTELLGHSLEEYRDVVHDTLRGLKPIVPTTNARGRIEHR